MSNMLILEKMESLQNQKSIEISVIIPSYNKYPLLELSLHNIVKQSFDNSAMEVILVDDNSTDGTMEKIKQWEPSFQHKLILLKENLGRARARNIGAAHASGRILVFLDAEMLVSDDFVTNHFNHHKNCSNKIVTGAMELASVYSYIFPEFPSSKLKQVKKLLKNSSFLMQKYQRFKRDGNLFQLISKDDLEYINLDNIAFKMKFLQSEILNKFGNDFRKFSMPWLAFLSGNISMTKKSFDEVGGFDEEFTGYGWEDRELGYRLYKAGKVFLYDEKVMSYHQEHPVSKSKWKESIQNLSLFQQKHDNIEILILILEFIKPRTKYSEMNEIIIEYNSLCATYQKDFSSLRSLLPEVLKGITEKILRGEKQNGFWKERGSTDGTALQLEHRRLRKLKKYNNLVKVIEKLLTFD